MLLKHAVRFGVAAWLALPASVSFLGLGTVDSAAVSAVAAQEVISHQAFRKEIETVYEQRKVTAYKLQQDVVYEDVPVTVYKPVTLTEYRDRTYTVRKAVPETTMQRQEEVSYRPVTTCQTQMVDQGGYVDQTVLRPGNTYNRLTWQRAGYVVDPVTGQSQWQRPGLHWTPLQAPAQVTTQRVYQPNLVSVNMPVTQMVPEVKAYEVPVTTYRYVDEVHTERVAIPVQKMVAEKTVERRPRMVTKRVPVTYQQLIPKTVVKMVPVPVEPCCNDVCCLPETTLGSETILESGAIGSEEPVQAAKPAVAEPPYSASAQRKNRSTRLVATPTRASTSPSDRPAPRAEPVLHY